MPETNPVALELAADSVRRLEAIDIERRPHCQRGR
jgi:hypothetical protein